MYVIFNHKGKQYKVSKDDILKLPKSSDLKKNDVLTLENIVLMKSEMMISLLVHPLLKM